MQIVLDNKARDGVVDLVGDAEDEVAFDEGEE